MPHPPHLARPHPTSPPRPPFPLCRRWAPTPVTTVLLVLLAASVLWATMRWCDYMPISKVSALRIWTRFPNKEKTGTIIWVGRLGGVSTTSFSNYFEMILKPCHNYFINNGHELIPSWPSYNVTTVPLFPNKNHPTHIPKLLRKYFKLSMPTCFNTMQNAPNWFERVFEL